MVIMSHSSSSSSSDGDDNDMDHDSTPDDGGFSTTSYEAAGAAAAAAAACASTTEETEKEKKDLDPTMPSTTLLDRLRRNDPSLRALHIRGDPVDAVLGRQRPRQQGKRRPVQQRRGGGGGRSDENRRDEGEAAERTGPSSPSEGTDRPVGGVEAAAAAALSLLQIISKIRNTTVTSLHIDHVVLDNEYDKQLLVAVACSLHRLTRFVVTVNQTSHLVAPNNPDFPRPPATARRTATTTAHHNDNNDNDRQEQQQQGQQHNNSGRSVHHRREWIGHAVAEILVGCRSNQLQTVSLQGCCCLLDSQSQVDAVARALTGMRKSSSTSTPTSTTTAAEAEAVADTDPATTPYPNYAATLQTFQLRRFIGPDLYDRRRRIIQAHHHRNSAAAAADPVVDLSGLVTALSRCAKLRSVSLQHHATVSDAALAALLRNCRSLERLSLVGAELRGPPASGASSPTAATANPLPETCQALSAATARARTATPPAAGRRSGSTARAAGTRSGRRCTNADDDVRGGGIAPLQHLELSLVDFPPMHSSRPHRSGRKRCASPTAGTSHDNNRIDDGTSFSYLVRAMSNSTLSTTLRHWTLVSLSLTQHDYTALAHCLSKSFHSLLRLDLTASVLQLQPSVSSMSPTSSSMSSSTWTANAFANGRTTTTTSSTPSSLFQSLSTSSLIWCKQFDYIIYQSIGCDGFHAFVRALQDNSSLRHVLFPFSCGYDKLLFQLDYPILYKVLRMYLALNRIGRSSVLEDRSGKWNQFLRTVGIDNTDVPPDCSWRFLLLNPSVIAG